MAEPITLTITDELLAIAAELQVSADKIQAKLAAASGSISPEQLQSVKAAFAATNEKFKALAS